MHAGKNLIVTSRCIHCRLASLVSARRAAIICPLDHDPGHLYLDHDSMTYCGHSTLS